MAVAVAVQAGFQLLFLFRDPAEQSRRKSVAIAPTARHVTESQSPILNLSQPSRTDSTDLLTHLHPNFPNTQLPNYTIHPVIPADACRIFPSGILSSPSSAQSQLPFRSCTSPWIWTASPLSFPTPSTASETRRQVESYCRFPRLPDYTIISMDYVWYTTTSLHQLVFLLQEINLIQLYLTPLS